MTLLMYQKQILLFQEYYQLDCLSIILSYGGSTGPRKFTQWFFVYEIYSTMKHLMKFVPSSNFFQPIFKKSSIR